MSVRAILFDVDFTLIYPGPMFRGEGYRAFCRRHGIDVDETVFEQAVSNAAPLLDGPGDAYDAELFVTYTRRIIEGMGGRGSRVEACAREIYDEWAACHHFELYEDVPPALRELAAAGVRIGLVSNSHRCLTSFQSHFELDGLIAGAISGPEHGFMKPNPSIFRAALERIQALPEESLMIGDSVQQDVEGALRTGMRAVLLHRRTEPHAEAHALAARGIPVVASLKDLPVILGQL